MELELPSTYHFEGWNIRYNLAVSDSKLASEKQQAKYVVFVHGTPWSSAVFQPTIRALLARESYHILLYDLPGYGQSQDLDTGGRIPTADESDFLGDTSVKFQAKALTELLKHVQLDGKEGHPTPAVVAHDIAGAIVLRAHLLHGCEFESMMLLDTNTVLPWGDGFYKLARSEPRPFLALPPKIFEAVVRAVIQSACYNPKVLQKGWEDILAQPWIGDASSGAGAEERQRSFVRQIAQANDKDVAEMLEGNSYAKVRCDVKIAWGEEDQWIPRNKIEDLIKRLDGKVKECAFIPEAGHLLMLDQPERFAIEVFDWLNRYGSRRSASTS
ncbi:hypothetical protein MMC10_009204 [Thelotrema lepadinum]|nr:hypothetical protein [Thelotrema lepadinum]